jgi:hypothetical protein
MGERVGENGEETAGASSAPADPSTTNRRRMPRKFGCRPGNLLVVGARGGDLKI